MKQKLNHFTALTAFLLFGIMLLTRCQNDNILISQFDQQVQMIQEKYVPDQTLDVFTAKIEKDRNAWLLKGETTIPEAGKELLVFADSVLGNNNYTNEFIQLPHPSLGDSVYGIVKVSVANIREKPRHSAQLVDQNIMGKTLLLLKYDRGWYLIQTEYGYIGWMTGDSFVQTDSSGLENWEKESKIRVGKLYPLVYSKPDENSEPVTDVVLNALLVLKEEGSFWSKVSTPDGRSGYIKTNCITTVETLKLSQEALRKNLILTARGMMGIPYLWGGNSSKGNDCSGFTQTTFKANGIELPRDSRQQALMGEEITPDDTFSNILPGDLLFFGSEDRVTHVGISLGGAEFIHQGSQVDLNSLDPQKENFSPFRRRTLKYIKRIF